METQNLKVVFMHTALPFNVRNGGEVAIQGCVEAVRELGFETSSIGYLDIGAAASMNPKERTVKQIPIEIESSKPYLVRSIVFALWLKIPLSCSKYFSKKYVRCAREALDGLDDGAVVIFDRTQMLWLLPYLGRLGVRVKLILIAQNVESELYRERREGKGSLITRWLLSRETKLLLAIEAEAKKKMDAIWCLTESDAEYFRMLPGSARVDVVEVPSLLTVESNAVKEVHCFADIGLLGTWSWAPNMESLLWFLDNVVPHVNKAARIVVAGSGCHHLKSRYPSIQFSGRVPSAIDFLAACKVIAIPAVSGNGVQVKTLDAIACGSSIVCTPHALRGISSPPLSVKVAGAPREFAECLNRELSVDVPDKSNRISAQEWTAQRKAAFKEKLWNLLACVGSPMSKPSVKHH